MSVTPESIRSLVDMYIAFANGGPFQPKIVKGITSGVSSLGGTWEYDDEKPLGSCFSGITIICWRFSGQSPAPAAAAYEDFALKNYNIWYHLSQSDKGPFAAECHTRTDGLSDWQQITMDIGARSQIVQNAINVTSAMYGTGKAETIASETLWNGRL